MAIDFKKTQKNLYQAGAQPSIIEVPEMLFIMLDGHGDPNDSPSYQAAVELLYGVAYGVKMSKKGGQPPEGYYDFVVPPLEGLWSTVNGDFEISSDKSSFIWTAMIRLPEFVSADVFEAVKASLMKKKPKLDTSALRLELFKEGLCAQVLHTGSYDSEAGTIDFLKTFINAEGYRFNLSAQRKHHELYLSDPRKSSPEKLKTIIRYPISKSIHSAA